MNICMVNDDFFNYDVEFVMQMIKVLLFPSPRVSFKTVCHKSYNRIMLCFQSQGEVSSREFEGVYKTDSLVYDFVLA